MENTLVGLGIVLGFAGGATLLFWLLGRGLLALLESALYSSPEDDEDTP